MKHLFFICFVVATIVDTIVAFIALDEPKAKNPSRYVTALIVVDVQNCFITGNLALSNSPAHQDGFEVVPIINHLIETIPFDIIVYTYDWHPSNHISFFENLATRREYLKGDQNRTVNMFDEVTYTGPKFETNQVLWPSHCIGGTDDAALHEKLRVVSTTNNVIHLRKGIDPDIDSYSAFADNNGVQKTSLDGQLRDRNVTQVFVAGLATDYCVAATALDAFDLNYKTYLIEDASRGVAPETITSRLAHLKQRGVGIIQVNQVEGLINNACHNFLNLLLIVSTNAMILLLK